MKCNGIDPSRGEQVEISFDNFITGVDSVVYPLVNTVQDSTYITPGWIDLQVNGFAGVDYNSPSASHEEIRRSIRAMLQTGVARFFPTVITGSPEDMLGALDNLARAKEATWEGSAME